MSEIIGKQNTLHAWLLTDIFMSVQYELELFKRVLKVAEDFALLTLTNIPTL